MLAKLWTESWGTTTSPLPPGFLHRPAQQRSCLLVCFEMKYSYHPCWNQKVHNHFSWHFKMISPFKHWYISGFDSVQNLVFWWATWPRNSCCPPLINSLAPGRSECDFKNAIFNLVLLAGIFRFSHDNALWWMPQYLTDDKSTLVQVMAWCRQATSHYLSQCWLSRLSPYGVARPQGVKLRLP